MPNAQVGDVLTSAMLNQVCPVGVVLPFAGSAVPGKWLACDGSAVSRTTYPDLFATIGTTYGAGDGSTTFNLPDLQGRVAVGLAGASGHADVKTIGGNEAAAIGSRRPKHNHAGNVNGVQAFSSTASSGSSGAAAGDRSQVVSPSVSVGPGTSPTDTPAYIVLNYIIKT